MNNIVRGFLELYPVEQKESFPILQVWFLLDGICQVGILFLRIIQTLWLIFSVNFYKKSHELFLNLSCDYYIEILLKANHFIAFVLSFVDDFHTSFFEENVLLFESFRI